MHDTVAHGRRGDAPAEDRADADRLVTALLTASRALVGVSARSLAGVEDTVTVTQFRTLVVLSAHGPTTLVQLAGRLEVNSSTAQRQVDRLLALGLVTREENPADRREVVIDLTAAGSRIVATVTRRRRAAIVEVVATLPVGQREQLIGALQAFSDAADEPDAASDAASRLGW